MKRSTPDEDAAALFRAAVRDVRPHPPSASNVVITKPATRIRAATSAAPRLHAESLNSVESELAAGDTLSFRRNHIPHRVLQRLRRGYYPSSAELDLHGMTASQAQHALEFFIHESLLSEHSCVRIIHGKGHNSGSRGPVLKNTVNAWLRLCNAVAAFSSARPLEGGSGVVLVLLQAV